MIQVTSINFILNLMMIVLMEEEDVDLQGTNQTWLWLSDTNACQLACCPDWLVG